MKYLKQFNNIKEAVGVPTGISEITNNLYNSILQKLSATVKFSVKEGDPRKYRFKTREIELNFQLPLKGKINDYEVESFDITIDITEVKTPSPDEPEISGAYFAPNMKFDRKNFKIIYNNTKKINIGIKLDFPWQENTNKEFWIQEIKSVLLKNKSIVLSSLGHELMHSYDLAFIKGGKKFEETADYSSSGNLKFGIQTVDKFFFYLYFMQKCEIIVKSVEFAIKMEAEGITKDTFLEFIKNETAWKTLRDISKWTYKGFHQELVEDVDLIKKKLKKNDIPTKGMTSDEIASFTEDLIIKNLSNSKVETIRDLLVDQNDILKSIRRITGNYDEDDEDDEEAIEKYYNDFIDNIKKDLENPKNFFVKREKMFNFESEKLMKKLSKLFSMVPDTKVNKLHTNISNKEIKTESILNWEKYQYSNGVNEKILNTFSWDKLKK
jgi:hypothetical protein